MDAKKPFPRYFKMYVLGMVRVFNEGSELTEPKRNEEYKIAHIKYVFTFRNRRIRD